MRQPVIIWTLEPPPRCVTWCESFIWSLTDQEQLIKNMPPTYMHTTWWSHTHFTANSYYFSSKQNVSLRVSTDLKCPVCSVCFGVKQMNEGWSQWQGLGRRVRLTDLPTEQVTTCVHKSQIAFLSVIIWNVYSSQLMIPWNVRALVQSGL